MNTTVKYKQPESPLEWKEYVKSQYTLVNNSVYDQIVVKAFSDAQSQARSRAIEECSRIVEQHLGSADEISMTIRKLLL